MLKCSGVAGASYVPTVQAALPRLLGAAAPPGAGARENRRQCLKVWMLLLILVVFSLTVGHIFLSPGFVGSKVVA
jgi:hypothetical protein